MVQVCQMVKCVYCLSPLPPSSDKMATFSSFNYTQLNVFSSNKEILYCYDIGVTVRIGLLMEVIETSLLFPWQ